MDVGKVYLVGGGPGDPGLLTLRGRQCLKEADLVLYDGLVNPLLLRHTKATAERTSRVDDPSGRRLDQSEINQRLVEAGRRGLTVVRLKGGDPFIFGRGSEEAQALANAGIPFEVVPGVTAATTAGGYAGFSLTHRDHASAVAFITGHEDPAKTETSLDYKALAAFPGTLVFYMGLHRLPVIAESLIDAGLRSSMPAAVVSRASTPRQRTVIGTLSDLPSKVKEAGVSPPSLIIVGTCVTLRESIAWFEQRPLFGMKIGITRPDHQADDEIEQALSLGAEPVLMPTVRIDPPEDEAAISAMIERLDMFDWLVFTSVNGVRSLLDRVWCSGVDVRHLAGLKIAAIGTSTASALEEYRLRADLVPEGFRSEGLATALAPHVNGKRVLWARANRGREVLPTALKAAGADVEELVVYQNNVVSEFPNSAAQLLSRGEVDWVGLSSPAIARQFASLIDSETRAHLGRRTKLVAVSPLTETAAVEAGLPISAVAKSSTWDGIFAAMMQTTHTDQT